MKKLYKSERGSLVIEATLIVIVIVAIGATIYTAQQKNKKVSDASVVQSSKQELPQKSPGPTVAPKPSSSNVVVIQELGIQLTLPAGLADMQYAQIYDYYGKPSGLGVTTKQIAQIDPNCTAANASIGALRIDDTNASPGIGAVVDRHDLGGGKALFLSEPNGWCFASSAIVNNQAIFEKDQQIQLQQTALLKQAIQTAQVIK